MSIRHVGGFTASGNHERLWNGWPDMPGVAVTEDDADLIGTFLGTGIVRKPDLVISPDGKPYLYRWHVIQRNNIANVYLHLQVADDPERPLHDHQYQSQSVILSGGYEEIYQLRPPHGPLFRRKLRKGDTAHRSEREAHRLVLLGDYSISLFTTGPRVKEWGFWIDREWHRWQDVTEGDYRQGGVSKWREA